MIPAALHSRAPSASAHGKGVLARAMKPQRRNNNDAKFPAIGAVPAKFAQPRPASSNLANASAAGSRSELNSVLVVMQTEHIDEYGQVWSIYVWRLTVFHPAERQVQGPITPKST